MSNGKLRVLPLGGIGEIGKNMTVLEYQGRILLIDCGLRFPTAEMLGIDLVLPDFGYLRDRVDDIDAILITHGHEDHLGALPWMLREFSGYTLPPVYGGPLTIAMARAKLDEHRIKDYQTVEWNDGDRFDIGPFTVEPIHMTHSIPDASAVAIETDLGTVLFTGDYKFDQTPVDDKPADFSRLAQLGEEGVLLLCGDSTNADRPGFSTSESEIGPHLLDIFGRCAGRVIVTSFASNIHRVQQVVDAAYALDRKVSLVGRSMRKNVKIGTHLGHIDIPQGMLIQPQEIEDFPDDRVVIISTGSQGEPLSALRRMAYNDHHHVKLHSGDTVLFSATPIPGNERAVNETVDRLFHIGCDVVTAADAPVHASGHGFVEEIKLMLNLTKPRYVMPVHGDFKRLSLHAQLAEAVGVPAENIFKGDNGIPLEIDENGASFGEKQQSGVIYVDGVNLGDLEDVALRDRRTLSADGVFVVVVTLSAQTGEIVADPEVICRGVPFVENDESLIDRIKGSVNESIAALEGGKQIDIDLLQQQLHDDIAVVIYKQLKRRPIITPVVVEV